MQKVAMGWWNQDGKSSLSPLLFLLPLSVLFGTWTYQGVPLFVSDLVALVLLLLSAVLLSRQQVQVALPLWLRVSAFLILIAVGIGIAQSSNVFAAFNAAKSWIVLPGLVAVVVPLVFLSKKNQVILSVFYGIWALGLVQTIISFWRLLQDQYIEGRISGLMNSPNAYAICAVLAIVSGLYLYSVHKPPTRLLFGVSIVLLLVGLGLSRSLGGFAALFAVILLVTIKLLKPRFRALGMFAMLILLIGGSAIALDRYQNFAGSSLNSRQQIWRVSAHLLAESPILGIGLRDFPDLYREKVRELYPLETDIVEKEVPEPHSLYLAWALYSGVFAALGYVLLLFGLFIKNLQSKEGVFAASLLLTFLVHGLVDTPFYRLDISILFWCSILIALLPLYEKRT